MKVLELIDEALFRALVDFPGAMEAVVREFQMLQAIDNACTTAAPTQDKAPIEPVIDPSLPGGTVYFIEATGAEQIKIGWTGLSVFNRLKSLQTGNAFVLKVVGVTPGTSQDEKALHAKFRDEHVRGEWFRASERLRQYIHVTAKREAEGARQKGKLAA